MTAVCSMLSTCPAPVPLPVRIEVEPADATTLEGFNPSASETSDTKDCSVACVPTGNLGGRLRMLASAYFYANFHRCRFYLDWLETPTVARWSELFAAHVLQPPRELQHTRLLTTTHHPNRSSLEAWLSGVNPFDVPSVVLSGGFHWRMPRADPDFFRRQAKELFEQLQPSKLVTADPGARRVLELAGTASSCTCSRQVGSLRLQPLRRASITARLEAWNSSALWSYMRAKVETTSVGGWSLAVPSSEQPTTPLPADEAQGGSSHGTELGAWLYGTLRSRSRIVTFFTGGLCADVRNLLHGLRQQQLEDLLVAFTLDSEAIRCAAQLGVEVRSELNADRTSGRPDSVTGEASFHSPQFSLITRHKLTAIDRMLEEGVFVFYLDVDVVVRADFLAHYFRLPPRDVYLQSDEPNPDVEIDRAVDICAVNLCSGVAFFVPNSATRQLVREWTTWFLQEADGAPRRHYVRSSHDQKALQDALRALCHRVTVGVLHPALYQNGGRFFGGGATGRPLRRDPPTYHVLHNNWLSGLAAKRARLQAHGLWEGGP